MVIHRGSYVLQLQQNPLCSSGIRTSLWQQREAKVFRQASALDLRLLF